MEINRPFPDLSTAEYAKIYQKVIGLDSYHEQYDDLISQLDSINTDTILYLHHYRYRLPWMIVKHTRNFQVEKLYSAFRPETDQLKRVDHSEIHEFFHSLVNDRLNILTKLAHNEQILTKSEPVLFNNCEVAIDSFVSSLVVPSLFGNFIGQQNVDDFIESVGRAFDSFDEQPFDFFLNFESSFLCRVLREFFFSPFFREYIGHQFSGFQSFFTFKKTGSEGFSCPRFQSFISLFFQEFMTPLKTAPSFFRKLFRRITAKLTPSHVIITVILHSLIVPMIGFPTIFSVLPNYQQFQPENSQTVRFLRYYIGIVCGLPLPDDFQDFPPIETFDRFDSNIVSKLIESLLEPEPEVLWDIPNFQPNTISAAALKRTAKIFGVNLPSLDNFNDMQILLFSPRKTLRALKLEGNKKYQLLAHAILKTHPNHVRQVAPSIRAEISMTKNEDIADFTSAVEKETETILEATVDFQFKVDQMSRILNACMSEFASTEANMCVLFVRAIVEENSFKSEYKKKKQQMLANDKVFCTFLVSMIENFVAKNPHASPMISHITKFLLAFLMQSFSLQAFADAHPEMKSLDEKFMLRKQSMLEQFQKNGYDEKVAFLLKSDRILVPALNAVLSSHLYENPVESSKQIVLAVSTVEDLFSFQYNEPPEGNQLMPLLANLFMTSPAPNPLTFSKWLAHFVQPVVKTKPEWFKQDDLHALEHFFQFNAWMEDMLNEEN